MIAISHLKLAKFRLKNHDNRDDTADEAYWQKYEELIDEKKEKLWDGLLYALQNYQLVSEYIFKRKMQQIFLSSFKKLYIVKYSTREPN